MNYAILKSELLDDPLGRGYGTMDDQQATIDLNTLYRTRDRISMTASEVLNTIDTAEWSVLADADQRKIWDILHMGGDLNPFGKEAQMFISVFGAGSNTILALADARTEDISRSQELGLGDVKVSDVYKARRQ